MVSPTPPPTIEGYIRQHDLEPAPWSGWLLFVGISLSLVGYVVSSLLMALLLDRYDLLNGPLTGIGVAATQLAMVAPVLIVILAHGNPVRSLGLNRFRWISLVELLFVLGVAFFVSFLWALFLALFDQRAQEPIVPLFGNSLWGFLAVFLVGAVFAPLVEEVVFRGFLFGGLLNSVPVPVAMVLSAFLFAALHLQPFAFPVLFFFGLLLALLYYRSGSLWIPIMMHFFINSVGLCAQFALEQVPEVATLVGLF